MEASTSELRTRAVELGRQTIQEIEIAADSIDSRTTDGGIRRNTLYWQLSSVPAAGEAVLRDDPVVAMLDLYAFGLQLSDFLASPAGTLAFGPDVPIAQRAIVRARQRWETVAASMGARVTDKNRADLVSWARENPIDRLPFTRASLSGDLSTRLRDEQTSIGATVGSMQESLDRLEFRISLLNDYAIKQAMWLSELASLEVGNTPEAMELRSALSSTRLLVEDAPDLVARERMALLADLDRQRLEALAALAEERVIVQEGISNERKIVLDAMVRERMIVVQELEGLRARLVADEYKVMDHLVLRLAELLGALLVVIAGGLFLLRRRAA